MALEIDLNKLLRVVELSSIKFKIDPILIKFTDLGVVGCNVDPGYTVLSYVRVGRELAKNYEAVGDLTFTEKVCRSLKKMFRADEYVKVSVSSDGVEISGSREVFRFGITSLTYEVPEFDVVEGEYGYVLRKPKVLASYRVDITELSKMAVGELITFEGGDTLQVTTEVDGGLYRKLIKVLECRVKPKDNVVQTFNSDDIVTIAELVGEHAWMLFTDGPLQITYTDKINKISGLYAVMPRSVT